MKIKLNPSDWVVLLTGSAATAVALGGYLLNQHSVRGERRTKVFAEAISAVFEYQELPFLVHRRLDTPESRVEVNKHVSAVLSRLAFFETWMSLESREVGLAYSNLTEQTRRQGGQHRNDAWNRPPASTDEEFRSVHRRYDIDNEPERNNCIIAMRRELLVYNIFLRRSTRKMVQEQRRQRHG